MRRLTGPLVLAMVLTGCGVGTVQVPLPTPDPSAASFCRALGTRLPGHLHGEKRRATSPESPFVTAWGSPAIALRCGVGRPAGLVPTSELTVVDGISWLPQPAGKPVTFTAVGRRAYVEVTVPAAYSPPGDVLSELTPAITAVIPANPDGSV